MSPTPSEPLSSVSTQRRSLLKGVLAAGLVTAPAVTSVALNTVSTSTVGGQLPKAHTTAPFPLRN